MEAIKSERSGVRNSVTVTGKSLIFPKGVPNMNNFVQFNANKRNKHEHTKAFFERSGALCDRSSGVPQIFLALTVFIAVLLNWTA